MVPDLSGLAVVTASVASTVRENVAVAVFDTESFAVTTILKVPEPVGVPVIAPPVESDSPAGSEEPLAAAQVHV